MRRIKIRRQDMAIQVKSEIGKLKKVMLHRPGKELEHLVPGDLERLLFDDIPYLKTAQTIYFLLSRRSMNTCCLQALCGERALK